MPHCDPEAVAMRAMGWPVAPDEDAADTEAHLATCPSCQSELDELRAVARTAITTTSDDVPVAPPPQVWERVAGELGLSPGTSRGGAADATPTVTHLGHERRRRRVPAWALAAAAAVLGVVLGGGVTLAVTGGDDGPPAVVARARLVPVPGNDVGGVARVVGTDQGRRLYVDVTRLPVHDGYYEVWLLDRTASRLVSVGVLVSDDATSFRVPPGLDLGSYPVVDVSREPYDGDPAHSKDSVTRGTLRT